MSQNRSSTFKNWSNKFCKIVQENAFSVSCKLSQFSVYANKIRAKTPANFLNFFAGLGQTQIQ